MVDSIPQRVGIDALIDRAEAAEEDWQAAERSLKALLLHHSEHHAPCDWQDATEPPRVAEGPLLGHRSGGEDGELSPLERARGTMTARRPVGSAPTAPESLDRLRQAVADYLHQRICDAPLFGDTRCARCAALHDPACRQKDPTAPHETRWCDGNTVSVTERAMAAALALGVPKAAGLALSNVGEGD